MPEYVFKISTNLTRASWKVLIVYVANSITSIRVTCIMPQYVSVPRLGQYWSHLIWKRNKIYHEDILNIFPYLKRGLAKLNKTYPCSLLQLGHHDNGCCSLFPDHSPEITESFRQRSLCRDVSVLLPVAIHVISVDVVTSWQSVLRLQYDPWVVVGYHVGISGNKVNFLVESIGFY